MNARQRRKNRRAQGIRPPYRCVWCGTELRAIGTCPGCKTQVKPFEELTLRELYRKAAARGVQIEFKFHDPMELKQED